MDDCTGCGCPQGHCDCGALNSEDERARWEEAYAHSTTQCWLCTGWFPKWALSPDGRCAGCQGTPPRGEVL